MQVYTRISPIRLNNEKCFANEKTHCKPIISAPYVNGGMCIVDNLSLVACKPLRRLLYSTSTPKDALRKDAQNVNGAKRDPRDETNACCQMGKEVGSLQPSVAQG